MKKSFFQIIKWKNSLMKLQISSGFPIYLSTTRNPLRINSFLKQLFFVLIGFVALHNISAQGTKISLNSAADVLWKIKPQSDFYGDSTKIFNLGFNTDSWVKAAVPGTVFASYYNAGLEKDPNYADNIYNVDKNKYYRNFWYRTEFKVSPDFANNIVWLNFDGVNRDADVWLNSKYLGKIQGFVQRGKFDISNLLKKNEANVLSVLVYIPRYSLSNGASPTYCSSSGWDWMPYVPGLNCGIHDNVFLTNSGTVTLSDPFIQTVTASSDSANLIVNVNVTNNSNKKQTGILSGTISPSGVSFSRKVTIDSSETKTITFHYTTNPELTIRKPKLWWPNGYGDQNMYNCSFKYTENNVESDKVDADFGIRTVVCDTTKNVMKIFVNGVKIFVKGGSWGMPEYMLRCDANEYDLKVKLHKDMNFNIIRNWMGSTTDASFYNACDKYGILIWDEFWLNSSGGLPRDIFVFNANSIEKIKRCRNHPSIVLWCGDNEGWPQPPLNGWLRANVQAYDTRHYHPNSHDESLTGSGPWTNLDPKEYFAGAGPGHWEGNDGWGLRSEIGSAVFVNIESFKKFIPADKLWPRNEVWNKHFYGNSAGNAGPDTYDKSINDRYGKPSGIEDFCKKAQLLNIETNKALYEGWTDNLWKDATGIIIWMSQSAYPSMVWQTYDYYYDATGAYWGAKKACEPVHIQWNLVSNTVKAINTTNNPLKNYSAEAEIYNMDGTLLSGLSKLANVNVAKDSLQTCFKLDFPSKNLALKMQTMVSSNISSSKGLVDGDPNSSWSSNRHSTTKELQFAIVDLSAIKNINSAKINWEDWGYAKSYKLQASADLKTWTDVYTNENGKSGIDTINFTPLDARYVRLLILDMGNSVGIRELEIYGDPKQQLSDVHFIKLKLKDASGKIVSDNFYWRGVNYLDFKSMKNMPTAELKVSSKVEKAGGKCYINVQVSNSPASKAIALTIHVQVLNSKTGERILPVIMNDNYFSLVKGETKDLKIEFDESKLEGAEPKLVVEQYNDHNNM